MPWVISTLTQTKFAAFLFDMDGTLLNSIAVVNRVWGQWALKHGLDPVAVGHTLHGRRAIDTVRDWQTPGMDVDLEAEAILQAELDDVVGLIEIPGAQAFLAALPPDRWALVTSAPRALALRRVRAAGLPLPAVIVTGDDVANGKPAPDCFLQAAKLLGVAASDCLVWEDAPAGIAAAEAAGASVMVIGTTHATPMQTPHPVVGGYTLLSVAVDEDGSLLLQAVNEG